MEVIPETCPVHGSDDKLIFETYFYISDWNTTAAT